MANLVLALTYPPPEVSPQEADTPLTIPLQMALRGPAGPAGADGAVDDFLFTQSVASATWTVNHNLGREPVVQVLTPGGLEMEALVQHMSSNQVLIYFASVQTGRVRCI